jgi:ABC-type uncharacterized transport system auxiliary subunit
MIRTVLLLSAALLLAACGKKQALEPAAGHALPEKPATSPAQPTADQLLVPPPSFRPGRSDELLTKSSTRPDDRFDLPPH